MSASSRLIPCHCINLRRAASHVTDFYNRALEPCDLTVSQFSVLWNLDLLGRSNTTALAERVGLERSTLARNLKPLLASGFITDAAGQGRRDRMLRVTDKGAKALAVGIPLWKTAQKEVFNLLGPDTVNNFKEILGQLQAL